MIWNCHELNISSAVSDDELIVFHKSSSTHHGINSRAASMTYDARRAANASDKTLAGHDKACFDHVMHNYIVHFDK